MNLKLVVCYLMVITLSSCSRQRNLVYFSDLDSKTGPYSKILNNGEPTILQNDILSVTVNSTSPESNVLFASQPVNQSVNGVYEREGYRVNETGTIKFPVLGKVSVEGLTISQAQNLIESQLNKYVKNAIVNIKFLNFRVTVIGEVNHPSTFTVSNEKINLLEALGLAGDMTAYGKRENVLLIREEDGRRIMERINLNRQDVLSSPYFYLKQNDVIYVEPDKAKSVEVSNNNRLMPLVGSNDLCSSGVGGHGFKIALSSFLKSIVMAYNKQNPINNPGVIAEGMKYVKYWYFFVLALVLSLGAAWLYLQTTVSKYKVSSTLLVQDDTKGDGLLKGTAFSDLNMFRSSKTVIDEMEVMRSRDLIQGVMKDLKMDVSYFYELALKNKELYGNTLPVNVVLNKNTDQAYIQKLSLTIINDHQFILNENGKRTIYNFGYAIVRPQFNITVVKGPAFSISDKVIQIRFVNLGQLAQAYSTAGLTVLPVIKDANTVVLSLLDAIPQRGIDILNALISRYNMENVNNKNIMALNTIKFIDGKLKFLTKNLSGVEQDVENYKRDNRITELSADAQMNLQSSGSYNEQLASSEVQLSLVQSLISYLRGGDASFELVPTTLGLKDPTLQNLTDKYNNLQIERERLLRNNSVNNPLVVSLTEQLSGLKGSLLENLTMIRRGLTLERNKLSSKTSQFESRLNHVPVMERGLLERSREQSVKTTLYQYLLQKREETELSLSATIPTSKLIDRPAYNPIPAKPKVQLIYMFSMMAGLMIPFSVIYLKDKLNSKVKDIYDVEYIAMNGKILGELSHKAIGESIVVHKNQSNTISELFRYIRSNLHFMDMNLHNKVLLVTSTSKGEGKTFFSINLGITLSLIDKKVVILEFDLRKPDLLNNMNLKSKTGLSDYLKSDKLQVDDILVKTPQSDHLFVIGCGEISDSPSEILMSPKLEILFKELRERFDYVIVDTSPVGHVADAFTIATFADSSIYLVRYNYTHKEDLAIFEEICENGRLKNPMIVFNDAGKGNKNAYKYGRYAYSA